VEIGERDNYIKYNDYMNCKVLESTETADTFTQFNVIFDMKGYSFRQLTGHGCKFRSSERNIVNSRSALNNMSLPVQVLMWRWRLSSDLKQTIRNTSKSDTLSMVGYHRFHKIDGIFSNLILTLLPRSYSQHQKSSVFSLLSSNHSCLQSRWPKSESLEAMHPSGN